MRKPRGGLHRGAIGRAGRYHRSEDSLSSEKVQRVNESTSYICRVVSTAALDRHTRRAMCDLYLSCYEATTPELFEGDLLSKDEVLLLHAGLRLVGFTTLRVFDTVWQGEGIRVVFSGDTVVDRQHWGQQALSLNWVRRMGQIKRLQPEKRLVWFLLVKGHRTYRYLQVFAKRLHPREGEHDPSLAALAGHLARQRFHDDYNPASGLVEFVPSRGQLKRDLAEPRPDEMSRPGVAYFLQRNPGFRLGHELVCVCDVEEDNMKPMTLRLFRQGCNASTREP